MDISGVSPSLYSGIPHGEGNEKEDQSEKTATTYSIAHNRVSKSEYDKYDKDGDGRISPTEEEAYKAEKNGGKTESENVSENNNIANLSTIGDNIDILA